MPWNSLWIFLKVIAQNLKSNFIAKKILFFEPPTTGNIRRKQRMYREYTQKPWMYQVYKRKSIFRAPSLTINVICAPFSTYQRM